MRNVKFPDVPGVTHDVGAHQGYIGISVKYVEENDDEPRRAEIMYQPDAQELRTLAEGGKIRLSLLLGERGKIQPHRLDVTP